MLSKSKQKYIHSLQRKKNRYIENIYLAEGKKTIDTIIKNGQEVLEVFCTDKFAIDSLSRVKNITRISREELESISLLKNPDDGLALVKIPNTTINSIVLNGWSIYLDRVNDPGNLGTIIRLADWYGVQSVFINKGTTDPYQPKVIQSTMGAISGVKIYFVDDEWLKQKSGDGLLFSTAMDGEKMQKKEFPKKGILVMGNEANGISEEILSFTDRKIAISQAPTSVSESLNVAMATGIFLDRILG